MSIARIEANPGNVTHVIIERIHPKKTIEIPVENLPEYITDSGLVQTPEGEPCDVVKVRIDGWEVCPWASSQWRRGRVREDFDRWVSWGLYTCSGSLLVRFERIGAPERERARVRRYWENQIADMIARNADESSLAYARFNLGRVSEPSR